MSDKKKKERDVFGTIGDFTYDTHNTYNNWTFDIFNLKYGIVALVLYILFGNLGSILTGDLPAILFIGIILSYALLYYYLYETEPDTESTIYKVMNTINTIIMVLLGIGGLIVFIRILNTL
jgi:hypothetical protein